MKLKDEDCVVVHVPNYGAWGFKRTVTVKVFHTLTGLWAESTDLRSVHANNNEACRLLAEKLKSYQGAPMELSELQNPPTLDNLIVKAREVEPKPRPLRYYLNVVRVLKDEKNMSGQQIADWLEANNCGKHLATSIYKLLRNHPKETQGES